MCDYTMTVFKKSNSIYVYNIEEEPTTLGVNRFISKPKDGENTENVAQVFGVSRSAFKKVVAWHATQEPQEIEGILGGILYKSEGNFADDITKHFQEIARNYTCKK